MDTGITFTFAAIFLGAAVLSSVALYARQPIIIAYIALGIGIGRWARGYYFTAIFTRARYEARGLVE